MKTHYSCAELAALKLPDFPTTERRFRDLVDRESWLFREEKSRGRGGVKRLYAPPEKVLKLIRKQECIEVFGSSSEVTLSLTVSLCEAAYIIRWLERRGRK